MKVIYTDKNGIGWMLDIFECDSGKLGITVEMIKSDTESIHDDDRSFADIIIGTDLKVVAG